MYPGPVSKMIGLGGRAAVFAPIRDLGLMIVDDEGHAAYKEGRSPRFHARTIAAQRARDAGARIVLIGVPPSVEARAATQQKAFTMRAPARADERTRRPAVVVVDDDTRLVPSQRTLSLARDALANKKRVVVIAPMSSMPSSNARRAS